MQPKVREALEASIKHWEENVAAGRPDEASTSSTECALCEMFLYGEQGCCDCLVGDKTGQTFCHGTPYIQADAALKRWRTNPNSLFFRYAFHAAARAELDFLRSLRED